MFSVGTFAPAGARVAEAPVTDPGRIAATEAAPGAGGLPAPPDPVPELRASAAPAAEGTVQAAADWRLVASPNRGAIDNHIHEVSCVNTLKCVAVGYNEDANGMRRSVVQTMIDGTWKLGVIPQRGNNINTLWNVSCVTGNRCFAVGYYGDANLGAYRTLIARYSGGYWSLVNSPNVGSKNNYLFGVDCVDATHCVAVGRYQVASLRYRTLVLALNGSTWSVQSSPNRQAAIRNNFLADVSCATVDSCVAVGYSLTDSLVYETLGIELTGGAWTLRSTRNVAASSNILRDVSCPAPGSCVAVGGSDPGTAEQTLVQRLSAGAWAIEASPNRADTDNHLWGVSCATETNCVAVGQSQNTERSWTLVETLDAGVWTQTPSPSRGGTFNYLYGVSCPNATTCTAAGDYINVTTQIYRSLIATNAA